MDVDPWDFQIWLIAALDPSHLHKDKQIISSLWSQAYVPSSLIFPISPLLSIRALIMLSSNWAYASNTCPKSLTVVTVCMASSYTSLAWWGTHNTIVYRQLYLGNKASYLHICMTLYISGSIMVFCAMGYVQSCMWPNLPKGGYYTWIQFATLKKHSFIWEQLLSWNFLLLV